MTGTASTIDGEADLQFESRDSTLAQNLTQLASSPYGGFVSNIDYRKLIVSGTDYPSNDYYTGETIQAIVAGPNVTANGGTVAQGQLCYWQFTGGVWSFDLVDGGPSRVNTYMLGIALSSAASGAIITFLLKGFVSTTYVSTSAGVEGSPLYVQRANFGFMCEAGAWSGTPGVDIWRSVGYLVSYTANTGGTKQVIRFDPSTDYII
jgi:hypothetical protein